MFVDSFSVGLDDLRGKDRTMKNILSILEKHGRFSCFEASANKWIAGTMTTLMRGTLIEQFVPDSYKGRREKDGCIAPNQNTYPWTYVRLTNAGRKML